MGEGCLRIPAGCGHVLLEHAAPLTLVILRKDAENHDQTLARCPCGAGAAVARAHLRLRARLAGRAHDRPLLADHPCPHLRRAARLEAAGLVSATEVAQQRRPDKRVYAITEAGEDALQAWLESAELGHERRRHPLLLRVYFGERIPPGRLASLLAAERARLEAARDQHAATVARLEGDQEAVWRRATALYGVRCAEGQLAWLDEVEPLIAPADRGS
jgi:DNA-binding PadR family transcriptional regulator